MRRRCEGNILNAERKLIFNNTQNIKQNRKEKHGKKSQKKQVDTKHRLSSTKARLLTKLTKIYENKRTKKGEKKLTYFPIQR